MKECSINYPQVKQNFKYIFGNISYLKNVHQKGLIGDKRVGLYAYILTDKPLDFSLCNSDKSLDNSLCIRLKEMKDFLWQAKDYLKRHKLIWNREKKDKILKEYYQLLNITKSSFILYFKNLKIEEQEQYCFQYPDLYFYIESPSLEFVLNFYRKYPNLVEQKIDEIRLIAIDESDLKKMLCFPELVFAYLKSQFSLDMIYSNYYEVSSNMKSNQKFEFNNRLCSNERGLKMEVVKSENELGVELQNKLYQLFCTIRAHGQLEVDKIDFCEYFLTSWPEESIDQAIKSLKSQAIINEYSDGRSILEICIPVMAAKMTGVTSELDDEVTTYYQKKKFKN